MYEVSVERDDEENETDEHGVCHVCATDWTCLGKKIVKHTIWGTWDTTCKNIYRRAARENVLQDISNLPEELIESIGEGTARIPISLKPVLRRERQHQRLNVNTAGFRGFAEPKHAKGTQGAQYDEGLN